MPALNFILPATPAGPSMAAPPAAPTEESRLMEKFQSVMERLAESFSNVQPQSNGNSEQTSSADRPARKKSDAGKCGEETAEIAQLLMPQMGTNPAPLPHVSMPSLPQCEETRIMAGMAAASAPIVSVGKVVEMSQTLPANTKGQSFGVIAVDVIGPKSVANSAPSSVVVSQAANGAGAGISNFSGSAPINTPTKSGGDWSESLSPLASEAPSTDSARSEIQPSHAEPVLGAPVSSAPEETADETAATPFGGRISELQETPTAIGVKSGVRPAASFALNSRSFDDGTAVAQQTAAMKTAEKTTNFSEAKQKLPGAPMEAAGENVPAVVKSVGNVNSRPQRASLPATITIRVEPARSCDAGISANAIADKTISPASTNLVQLPVQSPHYVQRTGEMISLQVAHLNEAGANEMRVVIKPDLGLQLSLHLQQRDGEVEVQAVLDRGNFGLLNQHWPELQQQLESRGVRVAPLASADQIFGGGSEGFRHPTTSHGQQAEDDAEPAGTPAVLLPGLPPAAATASASRLSAARLETWA